MYKTELGKIMRMIRNKRGENLATLSKKYGSSIAFLSAIEVGKSEVPLDYVQKINLLYSLTEEEYEILDKAVNDLREKSVYNFQNTIEKDCKVNKVFARKINNANQQSLAKLRKILEASE